MLNKVAWVAIIAAAVCFGAAQADPYTLDTCAVSGKSLGDSPVTKTIEGREVKFCCDKCAAKYEAEPAAFSAAVDEKMIAKQSETYPLDTCVVGGGKLGAMGEPVSKIIDNKLVKFCCGDCVTKFEADKATYMSKLNEAVVAKQTATYPMDTCLIKGEALSDKSINVVLGTQLVRVCCKGCEKKVNAEPAKYLAMVSDAAKK